MTVWLGYTSTSLRTQRAGLDGFFRILTLAQKEDIEVVSIDRENAYLKAIREHLPRVSVHPFHIIKNMSDAVDEVRRELFKKPQT